MRAPPGTGASALGLQGGGRYGSGMRLDLPLQGVGVYIEHVGKRPSKGFCIFATGPPIGAWMSLPLDTMTRTGGLKVPKEQPRTHRFPSSSLTS